MKPHHAMSILLLFSAVLWSSCRTEKALWIEVKENGERKTIAVTEGIARKLLESTNMNVSFTEKEDDELITREMLRAVLDGREPSITRHGDDGKMVTLSMKPVSLPGKNSGNDRLVLETYKSCEQTFRIALPELEISLGDDESEISVHANFDWKSWLPFLAKAGGGVYFKDHGEQTEVWLYVE
jgi:hypothetical protein